MKPIKPGESMTIPLVINTSRKPSDYDLVIEFDVPDPVLYPKKRRYTILLDLIDEGVDEKCRKE